MGLHMDTLRPHTELQIVLLDYFRWNHVGVCCYGLRLSIRCVNLLVAGGLREPATG